MLNYLQVFGVGGAAESLGGPQPNQRVTQSSAQPHAGEGCCHPALAVSSTASANESPMANAQCLQQRGWQATQTGRLPPARKSMAILNTSYLKL